MLRALSQVEMNTVVGGGPVGLIKRILKVFGIGAAEGAIGAGTYKLIA